MRSALIPILILVLAASGAGQSLTINTVAGGGFPSTPSTATTASLRPPMAAAVDVSGNCYFTSGHGVFRIDSAGVLTRIAGTPGGGPLGDGGLANRARLASPQGIAVDANGEIYIADTNNHRVRKVASNGTMSTVAGTGAPGFAGDGGPAANAQLAFPQGVAVDALGNLYIADTNNQRVRRVTPDGLIITVAGNGTRSYGGDGGQATSAQLYDPTGVAMDANGNLYISDRGNYRVRRVSAAGAISTFAGNGTRGYSGDNGPAASAQLYDPIQVALDATGNLYIADALNGRIRRVTPAGTISSVAGNGVPGFSGDGSLAVNAQLNKPAGVAADPAGNLYIADTDNRRIRKVLTGGSISTVAGDGTTGFSGDGAAAATAQLNEPQGVALDASGMLLIADTANHRVRQVAPGGTIVTLAGSGSPGFSGDSGAATSAQLFAPAGVAVDASGNVYIADSNNHRVRRITSGGLISTFAGTGALGYSGDGSPAASATLHYPYGLAIDGAGNLYIADTRNARIRKVNPAGTITTVAGTGAEGFAGDGGPAASAQLYAPLAVAVDTPGNLYIADTYNHRIRKVTPEGAISTVAGTGVAGSAGDGAAATSAQLNLPKGVAVDLLGNVYISDSNGRRIRMVGSDGKISTVAGNGTEGYSGDGGPATNAQLSHPVGLAVDLHGRVYVADSLNHAVRLLGSGSVSCTYAVAPTAIQAPVAGGVFTFSIETTASCAWTVSGLPAWITVSGPPSGTGSANVTLNIAANAGDQRNALIVIAGVSISVSQQGSSACGYSISPPSLSFPVTGGTGAVAINTATGCAWSVLNSLSWVTITGANAGTGPGSVNFQVAANSGGNRTGTILIAGLSFTIQQTGVAGMSLAGTFAHLASGGNWKTTWSIVNPSSTAVSIRLNFFDSSGLPLMLPLTFPQSATPAAVTTAATLDRTIAAGAVLVIDSAGPDNAAPLVGWAQLLSSGPVGAFGVFQQKVGAIQQEAVVPLESRGAVSYLLYFDNTSGFATGVALANITQQAVTFTVVVRDDTGATLQTYNVTLPPQGHTAFNLADRYSITGQKRGTLELRSPSAGQITALGIRFNPTFAFSTISTLVK
jgi:sugar lactone lactonase YvrE